MTSANPMVIDSNSWLQDFCRPRIRQVSGTLLFSTKMIGPKNRGSWPFQTGYW